MRRPRTTAPWSVATRIRQYLSLLGRQDEALTEAKRAVELDPLALMPNSYLAHAYYRARKLDEALEQSRLVLELDPNYDWRPAALRGHVFVAKGMYREVISEYGKFAASPHAYAPGCWRGSATPVRVRAIPVGRSNYWRRSGPLRNGSTYPPATLRWFTLDSVTKTKHLRGWKGV
jgi:tetratricopeptide (TPR) repeat protein